jgi:hypothetical protein
MNLNSICIDPPLQILGHQLQPGNPLAYKPHDVPFGNDQRCSTISFETKTPNPMNYLVLLQVKALHLLVPPLTSSLLVT